MSENDIPFSNLSRHEAEKQEWSPYARFCQSLHGYLVFHISTHEKWSKSELFTEFYDYPEELQMVSDRAHPNFKFIHKDEWTK